MEGRDSLGLVKANHLVTMKVGYMDLVKDEKYFQNALVTQDELRQRHKASVLRQELTLQRQCIGLERSTLILADEHDKTNAKYTHDFAECSILDRRLSKIKRLYRAGCEYLETMKGFAKLCEGNEVRVLKETARVICVYMKHPLDAINRYETLNKVKQESVVDYEEVYNRLAELTEEHRKYKEEKEETILTMFNTKIMMAQSLYGLESEVKNLEVEVADAETHLGVTQKLIHQLISAINLLYRRSVTDRGYGPAVTSPVEQLEQIEERLLLLAKAVYMVQKVQIGSASSDTDYRILLESGRNNSNISDTRIRASAKCKDKTSWFGARNNNRPKSVYYEQTINVCNNAPFGNAVGQFDSLSGIKGLTFKINDSLNSTVQQVRSSYIEAVHTYDCHGKKRAKTPTGDKHDYFMSGMEECRNDQSMLYDPDGQTKSESTKLCESKEKPSYDTIYYDPLSDTQNTNTTHQLTSGRKIIESKTLLKGNTGKDFNLTKINSPTKVCHQTESLKLKCIPPFDKSCKLCSNWTERIAGYKKVRLGNISFRGDHKPLMGMGMRDVTVTVSGNGKNESSFSVHPSSLKKESSKNFCVATSKYGKESDKFKKSMFYSKYNNDYGIKVKHRDSKMPSTIPEVVTKQNKTTHASRTTTTTSVLPKINAASISLPSVN